MAQQLENLEVEVKFLVTDLPAIREKVLALGAVLTVPRVYEHNIVFDNVWRGLGRKGQVLRLRQDQRARLTFKGLPHPSQLNSEARVREELEVEVSDFATLATLLSRVGFEAVREYEKYRESFAVAGAEIVLDELPFGHFVELEGEEAVIRELAARLGLDWHARILMSYMALMERLKAHYQLAFDDLTFANFQGQPLSVADILA